MPIQTLFPTFLYTEMLQKTSLERFNQELLKEIETYAELDTDGQAWSEKNYFGGYTSYATMSELHQMSPTFARLKKQLDRHVRKFTAFLEMDLKGHTVEMESCWINIMPQGTSHSSHLHPLSLISGTYYVQVPARSSALQLEDPRLGLMMAAPPKKDGCHTRNRSFVRSNPKAGQLILFESWLRHEVPPNPSPEERISISFNYRWS
jgi:uncharacterized protein (TIGR02466 family)